MKNEYYTTEDFNTGFGGYVYEYDFDGYNSMTEIAARILADMRFDKHCAMNATNRNRYKKGMN